MPFGERAMEALKVSLLGIGAVFGVLALIFAILTLFRVVFTKKPAPKKANVEAPAAKTPVQKPTAPAPVSAPSADNSVIAAISAAVAMMLEDECKANGTTYNGFRIVSVRRSDKGRSWTQKN